MDVLKELAYQTSVLEINIVRIPMSVEMDFVNKHAKI